MVDLTREKDAETLRTAALLLERENRRLLEKNLALQARLAELEGKVPADLQQRLAMLEEQLAQRVVNDNYLCRLATTSPAGSDGQDGPA